MSSSDDFQPPNYGTPSPYKRKKPKGLRLKKCSNKDKKERIELTNKIEEIAKIEEKYNRRILQNINNQFTQKITVRKEIIDTIITSPGASGSRSRDYELLKDLMGSMHQVHPSKTYFHPNKYFIKFNQDSLLHSDFILDENLYLKQFTMEDILDLIQAETLVIPECDPEKTNFIKFLLYLGSVTESVTVANRISQLLSGNNVQFSDFIAIVENWGRTNETTDNTKHEGTPQCHNFELVLGLVIHSIERYSLSQVKELFTFLIEVSLDQLFISLAHILLQPIKLCCQELYNKGLKKGNIVALLNYQQWNTLDAVHIMSLLTNSGVQQEICILFGFKILAHFLSVKQKLVSHDIKLKTIFNIFQKAETKLISLDTHTVCQLWLIFELIGYQIRNKEEFDICDVINFIKKIKNKVNSEMKSLYFNDIIARMEIMWNITK